LKKDKIFAYINLTDPELEVYNRYYQLFREQLPAPDLVIYLQAVARRAEKTPAQEKMWPARPR